MQAKDLFEHHSSLARDMSVDYEWTAERNIAMHQAFIAIAQVEQLEKLNANLERIELTLRHNMEVAVIQP